MNVGAWRDRGGQERGRETEPEARGLCFSERPRQCRVCEGVTGAHTLEIRLRGQGSRRLSASSVARDADEILPRRLRPRLRFRSDF